jgi:hypothetical protein
VSVIPFSEVATVPPSRRQLTTDIIPWAVDFTEQLQTGQTVTSPSTKMIDQGTGATITLSDAPSVAGNIVSQVVRGSELTAGHRYWLIFNYVAGVLTTLGAVLEIDVPL